jgi:hypothetical protein
MTCDNRPNDGRHVREGGILVNVKSIGLSAIVALVVVVVYDQVKARSGK